MYSTIEDKIARLKAVRNAVILAHNYQCGAVQDIADFVGDSLGLARRAAQVEAEVIVFCGVRFMAETAAILSPGKTVLLPEPESLCPMAQMIDVRELRAMKERHPDAVVVSYVNSTASVKALTDVCCTSSNAVAVVESLDPDRPVIFVPDRNLGHYVQSQTARPLVLSNGYCPTHVRILPEHISEHRKRYPDAEVMVHPECLPAVVQMADVVASTSGMLRHASRSPARLLVVGTEVGLLHRLRKENMDKEFIPATPSATCPNMKRTTLESVLWALEDMVHEVTIPQEIAAPARRSLGRMLQIPNRRRQPAGSAK